MMMYSCALQDRITKLETRRIDLEEEIGRLKTNAAAERLNMEEQLMNAKTKIRAEEVSLWAPYLVLVDSVTPYMTVPSTTTHLNTQVQKTRPNLQTF